MKKQTVLSFFTDLLLILLMTAGSLACLQTGFSITVEADILPLCLVWAVICLICWQLKRGWSALLALLALYGLYLWQQDHFALFRQFIQLIGGYYYRAYGWDPAGLFSSAGPYLEYVDMSPCFGMLGVLIVFVNSLVLTKRLPVSCSVPVTLLPLIATLVITDSPPHEFAVFLLLLGFVLLVLSHTARRRERYEGSKLTAMLLIPVALALVVFMNTYSQSEYVRPDLEDSILSFLYPTVHVERPPAPGTTQDTQPTGGVGPSIDVAGSRVDLDKVGPKSQSKQQVMRVQASYQDLIYLRGRSYGRYMGIMWDTEDSTEVFSVYPSYLARNTLTQQVQVGSVTVRTASSRAIQYVPYYVNQELTLQYGSLINEDKAFSYRFETVHLIPDWRSQLRDHYSELFISQVQKDHPELEPYWTLTDSTREQAVQILEELELGDSVLIHEAASVIGSYVRNSAKYDLNTQAMPAEEMDFALWFLQESETGYCVHFASAAVVLLRAAGIPARYVEGYVTRTDRLNTLGMYQSTVQEKDAHAWAEYYVPHVGWVVLEATPADFYQPIVPPTTGPTETTEPTLPPTITTRPPQTTSPTLPGTEPTVTEPTVTEPTQTLTGGPVTQPIRIPDWVWQTALWVAGSLIFLWLQWLLRLKLHLACLRRGEANKRAIRCWRYGRRLSRLLHLAPPEALFQLARQARYSRNGVTEEALTAAFDAYMDDCVEKLRKRNILLRFIYRVILAVY